MTLVARLVENFVSYVMRSNHESDFSCQAQYLVKLEDDSSVALRVVNTLSDVTRINRESHFAWQAQYLVKLEDDSWCSAQCKQRFICAKDQS